MGEDPIEENILGSWEDYYPWYITAANKEMAMMYKAAGAETIYEDLAIQTKWEEENLGAQS